MPPSRSSKDRETNKARILANRYEIVRKLGSGNFGTAFLCKDFKNKNEQKVLKEISVGDLQPDETVDAMHEARLLSKLDHPNIVRFHDSFIDGEFFCIITEYCEGNDLGHRIEEFKKKKSHFAENLVLDWVVQLLLAVQYMHCRRVLHRDLKTRNIFLKNNMVKIGDFGISRILMGTTDMASTFTGTPYYMSPEVLKHEGYNSKSDIWSIGCILYEVCALQHAFDGQGLMAVMYKIVEGQPPDLPSHYSRELNGVFKKMLEKDPEKRPSASEVMKLSYVASHMTKMKTLLSSDDYKSKHSHSQDRVDREANEIAQLLREKSHLDDLRKTEELKRAEEPKQKKITPRERMRLRKMQEADRKAQMLSQCASVQREENMERKSAIKSTLQQTSVPPWMGGEEGARLKDALTKGGATLGSSSSSSSRFSRTTPNFKFREEDEEDEEEDEYPTVMKRFSRSMVSPGGINASISSLDRPITPMKNTMVYDVSNSSLDFKDGIPDKPELAETYYSQFEDEFENDGEEEEEGGESDEEGSTIVYGGPVDGGSEGDGTLVEETQRDMESFIHYLEGALDKEDPEGTLTVQDDSHSGAFGPHARQVKISNLRGECVKILGQETFEKAYNYLKDARYGHQSTVNEGSIMQGLRNIVKNPSDCFLVDQLLFLEEQAKFH